LMEFEEAMRFPSPVLGPVDRRLLAIFAVTCAALDMMFVLLLSVSLIAWG